MDWTAIATLDMSGPTAEITIACTASAFSFRLKTHSQQTDGEKADTPWPCTASAFLFRQMVVGSYLASQGVRFLVQPSALYLRLLPTILLRLLVTVMKTYIFQNHHNLHLLPHRKTSQLVQTRPELGHNPKDRKYFCHTYIHCWLYSWQGFNNYNKSVGCCYLFVECTWIKLSHSFKEMAGYISKASNW